MRVFSGVVKFGGFPLSSKSMIFKGPYLHIAQLLEAYNLHRTWVLCVLSYSAIKLYSPKSLFESVFLGPFWAS